MSADRVTVVLPVFQRSVDKFACAWEKQTGGKYTGTCFEVHWYHCFENEWHGRTFAQHLRAVQEHTNELHKHPIVVGEWSLALGFGAQPGKLSKDDMRAVFAHAQLAAYQEASHGWFFWTWNDQQGIDWDWRRSFDEGYFSLNEDLLKLPELPPAKQDIVHEDPLESVFDMPASDPRVRLGDTIYLRAFNGRYLDVEGTKVRARFGDRGKWQQFVLCPCEPTAVDDDFLLRDGDVACLLAHNGNFLGVHGERVDASIQHINSQCAFVVHIEASAEVRHRSHIFLQSLETSKFLAPNESESRSKEEIVARWGDRGRWQRLVVEKPLSTVVTPRRPRRRSSFSIPGVSSPAPRQSIEGDGTPRSLRRRRSSLGSAGRAPAPRAAAEAEAAADSPAQCCGAATSEARADMEDSACRVVRRRRSSVAARAPPITPRRLIGAAADDDSSSGGSGSSSTAHLPCELTATPRRPRRSISSMVGVNQPDASAPATVAHASVPVQPVACKRRRSSKGPAPELTGLPTPTRRRN